MALPLEFAGLPTAPPETLGLHPGRLERLARTLEHDLAGRAPGVSALIGRHGKIGFKATLGALKPGGPAMPDDAIFRIYSMTKPIVSVAAMQLVEEGRLFLSDPVSRFVMEFKELKVGVERGEELTLAPLEREMTVQDLLRHTSGLTYHFTGTHAVQKLMAKSWPLSPDRSGPENMAALAALPLQHQPGTRWEYSVSTEVLGHLLTVVEGAPLGEVLSERIFEPLGMHDTGFFTPAENLPRRAEMLDPKVFEKGVIPETSRTTPPLFAEGGGGLASTLGDYARFCEMLRAGGTLDGKRILGPKTLAYMTSDHLGALNQGHMFLPPGFGFGLGFCVRTAAGLAAHPGSVGDYFWGGGAGTSFWVSPANDLFAVLMVQAPVDFLYYGTLFRALVSAALD